MSVGEEHDRAASAWSQKQFDAMPLPVLRAWYHWERPRTQANGWLVHPGWPERLNDLPAGHKPKELQFLWRAVRESSRDYRDNWGGWSETTLHALTVDEAVDVLLHAAKRAGLEARVERRADSTHGAWWVVDVRKGLPFAGGVEWVEYKTGRANASLEEDVWGAIVKVVEAFPEAFA